MSKKREIPIIFFNASVILAGLKSPPGGSGKLLKWVVQGRIRGITSEIIIDEVIRNVGKLGLRKKEIKQLGEVFEFVSPAPKGSSVKTYEKVVVDYGDAHILASCKETKAYFLVTLDKKHLLVLQNRIKRPKIVSPKGLIETLSKRRK